jgi:uncharacterized protein YbjT (DUF2867 family)
MSSPERIILVIGATGRQGGAAARRLRDEGWTVRVLVRDTSSLAARALESDGIHPVIGDLSDPASLRAAAEGVHGLFAITTDQVDGHRETQHGRNLVDAAAHAEVGHVVFSSVGGAERGTRLPGWEVKWEIEQYLRSSGLPATVLRPVRFMENHTVPSPVGGITEGTLVHVFPPDVPVQLVAVEDIAAFAALALADPASYVGEALELAGDERTSAEIVALIGRAVGRPLGYRQWHAEEPSGMGEEFDRNNAHVIRTMLQQAGGQGFWRADIGGLRRRHPGLQDLPMWLDRGGATRIASLLAADGAGVPSVAT